MKVGRTDFLTESIRCRSLVSRFRSTFYSILDSISDISFWKNRVRFLILLFDKRSLSDRFPTDWSTNKTSHRSLELRLLLPARSSVPIVSKEDFLPVDFVPRSISFRRRSPASHCCPLFDVVSVERSEEAYSVWTIDCLSVSADRKIAFHVVQFSS